MPSLCWLRMFLTFRYSLGAYKISNVYSFIVIVIIAFHPGIYKQVLCFSLYITHPIQHALVLNLPGQVNIYPLFFIVYSNLGN